MNALPTPSDASDDRRRLTLSTLLDGEANPMDADRACAAWSDDVELRRTWHVYSLIGDALRSDELCGRPARDGALLAAVRARLADEPVVLAPQPAVVSAQVGTGRVGAWRVPVAIAAGVFAVAGVVAVLQPAVLGGGDGPTLASSPAPGPAPGVVLVGSHGGGSVAAPLVSRDQMLRDARVDEYLRAHRDAFAGSPAALPGGAMRSVEFQPSSR